MQHSQMLTITQTSIDELYVAAFSSMNVSVSLLLSACVVSGCIGLSDSTSMSVCLVCLSVWLLRGTRDVLQSTPSAAGTPSSADGLLQGQASPEFAPHSNAIPKGRDELQHAKRAPWFTFKQAGGSLSVHTTSKHDLHIDGKQVLSVIGADQLQDWR